MGFRSRAAGALLALGLLAAAPAAWAGSSLSAWRVSREGSLELRTQPGVSVQAFYEEGLGGYTYLEEPG